MITRLFASSTWRESRSVIAALLVVFGNSAYGQIYVASSAGGYVGEYTDLGAAVNQTLIPSLGYPWGMTWDGGGNLYVAQEGSRTVGQYTTSGTPVHSSLISVAGDPEGVALDGNGHIFVVDALFGTVGEYGTSGTPLNTSLITGLPGNGFASIVCDGNGHLFVANSGSGKIAEYSTSGTLLNSSLITLGGVYSMACDGKGHLFTAAGGIVGEYTTSGATVNSSLISGLDPREYGIALNGSGNIFVSNFSQGSIGEYSSTGVPIDASLVTGLYEPMGIVVVPEPSFSVLALVGSVILIYRTKPKGNHEGGRKQVRSFVTGHFKTSQSGSSQNQPL